MFSVVVSKVGFQNILMHAVGVCFQTRLRGAVPGLLSRDVAKLCFGFLMQFIPSCHFQGVLPACVPGLLSVKVINFSFQNPFMVCSWRLLSISASMSCPRSSSNRHFHGLLAGSVSVLHSTVFPRFAFAWGANSLTRRGLCLRTWLGVAL